MFNKKTSSERYDTYSGMSWDKSHPFRLNNKAPRKISENSNTEGKINVGFRRNSDFRNVRKFKFSQSPEKLIQIISKTKRDHACLSTIHLL